MAVQFAVEHTRNSEYLINPRDIKFNPELNGRHELPDIEWLVKSFLKIGQLEPVLIRNDGGTPFLAMGFSRLRAALEINKRKLLKDPKGNVIEFKLRCVHLKASEQEGFLCNVAENLERNATTPIDDGYNMARMERFGMTTEQIAEFYHPKDELGNLLDPKAAIKWVKDRMSYVSLSEEALAAVRSGKVKPNAVQVLAKLSQEQQKAALKAKGKVTAASLKDTAAKSTNGTGKDTSTGTGTGKKVGRPPKASKDKGDSPNSKPVENTSKVKIALAKVLEEGQMPRDLDVSKMPPEDAVYAVCGILLDILEGR